jgi:hypothetical protein
LSRLRLAGLAQKVGDIMSNEDNWQRGSRFPGVFL